MSSSAPCPVCGQPLPPGAPQGLCPACLLKAGAPTGSPVLSAARRAFIPPTPAELAPQFPQLEIVELIGQGGMGAVYRARQPSLDRQVALKILPPQTGADPGFAERFTREARALARLNHPNIVGVHDFGQAGPYHYLLMEFVDGMNLRQLLQSGKIAPREALTIVPPICDALQYAHDQRIVHRDIKPENILIGKNGAVKIADFGLAKLVGTETTGFTLTGDRDVMGTPHYMAPEQVEKPLEVDHRADIFSLGVVFYQMLTGELPLGRFAPPSRKVQVDVRLDEVVLRALEKEPEQRYQQATALKTDVETIHAGRAQPVAGATTSAAAVPPTTVQRWGRRFAVAALAVLLVLALGFPVMIFARAFALFSHDPVGESLRIGFATIMTLAAGYILHRIWRSYRLGAAVPPIPRRLWIGGLAVSAVMLGMQLVHRPPAPPPRVSRPIAQGNFRGEVRNFAPSVVNNPLLRRYAIVQGWLFEMPDTLTLGPANLAAAQDGRLAGVGSQVIFPPTSTYTGISIAANVRFSPENNAELKVTPVITTRGFNYKVALQMANAAPPGQPGSSTSTGKATGWQMATEGQIAPREPLILEVGSFSPGRKHVAVFLFQRWSSEIFTDPSALQPLAKAEPPAAVASPAPQTPPRARPASPTPPREDFLPYFEQAGTRTTLAPRDEPQPAQPGPSRKSLPPHSDYDAMESDPDILKVLLENAAADRELVKARYEVGLVSGDELQAVEARQQQLEARLKGDRIAFATVAVTQGQKQVAAVRDRRNSGVATDLEVRAAESALQIAEIRLRREKESQAAVAPVPSGSVPSPASYPEYEAMESDPDILKILLRQANMERELVQSRYKSGVADASEVQQSELKIEKLEARLRGNRVAFASTILSHAAKVFELTRQRHHTGTVTVLELQAAQTALEAAELRLKRELAHAQATSPASPR